MIRKVKGGYLPVSEEGKRFLKKPVSRKAAEKRLREVEYFKHAKRRKG